MDEEGSGESEAGVADAAFHQVGEQLARRLHLKSTNLQDTLDAVVTAAVSTVDPAEYAGLILVRRGELIPQSTIGRPPHELDLHQKESGVGPCLEAAASQSLIVVTDTRLDDRWVAFSAHAERIGVRSMVCAPLWVDDQTLGTLSLYSTVASAFSTADCDLAELFATHAAIALANARQISELDVAMKNRDVIGQAKGILMERHRLSADGAFQRLSVVSQQTNRKLVSVAEDLVRTGELPS